MSSLTVTTVVCIVLLTVVGANPLPTYSKAAAVPTVSYSTSYTPVQKTHAVASLKPVVSYKPVTEYQTTVQYQPTLTKHHPLAAKSAQVIQASSSKERRVLYGKSGIASQAVAVAVPTASYSKSYQPVQTTRAVTSLKPVVSYKPVTEYQTVTQYQPTLSKHHTTSVVSVAAGKGRRLLYGKSGVAAQSVAAAIPTASYTKSYAPVQTTRAVTSLKPVVSYKPVTEYQTVTQYQPTVSKHHTATLVQVAAGKGHRVLVGKTAAAAPSVAVPTVSYSKSYQPIQATRAVTSYKPVVSYKPVTEYQTVTQYQPTLNKHHSAQVYGKRRQLGEEESTPSVTSEESTEEPANAQADEQASIVSDSPSDMSEAEEEPANGETDSHENDQATESVLGEEQTKGEDTEEHSQEIHEAEI